MEHAHEEQHFRKLVDSFVKCTTTIFVKLCYCGQHYRVDKRMEGLVTKELQAVE